MEHPIEASLHLAVVGASNTPLCSRRGRASALLAHNWEVVALGLNPTGPLPETTTLCQLPARAVPRAFLGSGLALVYSPSGVVLTTSPHPLLPQSYTPTVFERLTVNLQMKVKPVHLQIWDTAGGCSGLGEVQGGKRGPRG